MEQYGFRDVIPNKILEQNFCETSCYGCEFCIKLCEKNNLMIRLYRNFMYRVKCGRRNKRTANKKIF